MKTTMRARLRRLENHLVQPGGLLLVSEPCPTVDEWLDTWEVDQIEPNAPGSEANTIPGAPIRLTRQMGRTIYFRPEREA